MISMETQLSMTSSIENAFGSRLMTESGFLLNNQLTDFSFNERIDGKLIANRLDAFGSRLMTESGFLLNNQLTDFSFNDKIDGKLISNPIRASLKGKIINGTNNSIEHGTNHYHYYRLSRWQLIF